MLDFDREQQRVRQVYADRDAHGKPDLYAWHRQDVIYSTYRRRSMWARALVQSGLTDLGRAEVLDVGCGSGDWLRMLIEWGADAARLHGVDLLEDRVAAAIRLCPPETDLKVGTGWELPFADDSMDLCSASTVFSSIPDADYQRAVAGEMIRVLKPGGWVMVFDYSVSDPRNPDTRGLGRKAVLDLFPGLEYASPARLLLPAPLLRRLPGWSYWLVWALETMIPLGTHRIYRLRK